MASPCARRPCPCRDHDLAGARLGRCPRRRPGRAARRRPRWCRSRAGRRRRRRVAGENRTGTTIARRAAASMSVATVGGRPTMPKSPESTTKSPAKLSSSALSIDARIEELTTRKNATSPTPIISAWAVADVRRGLRPALSRASSPGDAPEPLPPERRARAAHRAGPARGRRARGRRTPDRRPGPRSRPCRPRRRRRPRRRPPARTTRPTTNRTRDRPSGVDRDLAHGGQRRDTGRPPRREEGRHHGHDARR